MKKIVLITLLLIVSTVKVSACVELTIDKHIGGDPVCLLSSGSKLEICIDDKTISSGGSCNFYIQSVRVNGDLQIYEFGLDKSTPWFIAPKFGELMINVKTQKLAFEINNITGTYSYFNESQTKQNRKDINKVLDDEDVKITEAIKLAVSKQEYYKANSLESKARAGRIDRDLRWKYESQIRNEKIILDKLYSEYKSNFMNIKKEYQSNPDAFQSIYSDNIIKKIIVIDGVDAYNKVFKPSFNPEKENARIKNLKENRFKCQKVNGKFLISSEGFNAKYYNEVYENQNFDVIKINPRYDSVSNNFYVTLDFNKNDTLRYQGIYDGDYEFNSSVYTLPYPSDLKVILDKIQTQGDRYTLEKYPLLSFSFGIGESIPVKNLNKIDFSREKADYKYDKLRSEFVSFDNQYRSNRRDDRVNENIVLKSDNFFNPFLKLLIKRMHPEYDSILLIKKFIGAKHYPESDVIFEKFGIVMSGGFNDDYKKFIILPIKQGVIEYNKNSKNKNNLLKVFVDENICQEFEVDVEEQSISSIKNFSIDNFIIDSSFVPEKGVAIRNFEYKLIDRSLLNDKEFISNQYLFNYRELNYVGELRYNNGSGLQLPYRYLFNNNISIQLVQLTEQNSMIDLKLADKYDENYILRNIGGPFNNTSHYLYSVLKCLRYKKEGDLKKYNKQKIKLENWK